MLPLIPLLISAVPSIASWIFGDSTGKVAQQVVDTAKQVLGTDDPAAAAAALNADPNLRVQLQMAIIQQQTELERIAKQAEKDERQAQIDELKTQLADVQSARGQTVSLAQTHSGIAWGAPVVSFLAVVVFGLIVYLAYFSDMTLDDKRFSIINILVGTAASGFTMVLSYWLGSSAGSAQKTALVDSLSQKVTDLRQTLTK